MLIRVNCHGPGAAVHGDHLTRADDASGIFDSGYTRNAELPRNSGRVAEYSSNLDDDRGCGDKKRCPGSISDGRY